MSVEFKHPKKCLRFVTCKFVGDNGCLMGCDYRLESAQQGNMVAEKSTDNSESFKCRPSTYFGDCPHCGKGIKVFPGSTVTLIYPCLDEKPDVS